jgi:hypothetical protein
VIGDPQGLPHRSCFQQRFPGRLHAFKQLTCSLSPFQRRRRISMLSSHPWTRMAMDASLQAISTRMLDKMRLHSKILRAWMVTLLAFRKKISTNS